MGASLRAEVTDVRLFLRCYRLLKHIRRAAEKSDYQVEKLLEMTRD